MPKVDVIDLNNQKVGEVELSDEELSARRKAEEALGKEAFRPKGREREISLALKVYAFLASSADTGAVRKLPQ